jgi:hypothetical protein
VPATSINHFGQFIAMRLELFDSHIAQRPDVRIKLRQMTDTSFSLLAPFIVSA